MSERSQTSAQKRHVIFYSLQKKKTAGSSSQTSRPRRAAAHARFPFNEADPETKLGGTEVKLKQVPLLGLQGPADP